MTADNESESIEQYEELCRLILSRFGETFEDAAVGRSLAECITKCSSDREVMEWDSERKLLLSYLPSDYDPEKYFRSYCSVRNL